MFGDFYSSDIPVPDKYLMSVSKVIIIKECLIFVHCPIKLIYAIFLKCIQ